MVARSHGLQVKTDDELRLMRRSGLVVARALREMAAAAVPGATTADVNEAGAQVLRSAGAGSSFLGYTPYPGIDPYPAIACVSVNDEVIHAIPGPRVLDDGDLVSIDTGAHLAGFHADAAVTVEVGTVSAEAHALSEVTRAAMWAGVGAARLFGTVGDISAAVEAAVRAAPTRYGIVTDYTGHGIGTAMHMAPDVPNRGRRGRGPTIVRGLALAIEPMITAGRGQVWEDEDGWAVLTADGSCAAHWEHTITVTSRGVWVLTSEDGGEAALAEVGARFGPLGD